MATEPVPLSFSEILKDLRGALLTVGGLIISATFQAGLNPPSGKENEYPNFIYKNTQAFINSIMFTVLLLVSYSTTDQRLLGAFLFFVMGSMITTLVYLGLAYTSGSTDAGTLAGIRSSAIIYACILAVFLIVVWWCGRKKENVPANNPAAVAANNPAAVEFGAMS